jgi:hypothetical protein
MSTKPCSDIAVLPVLVCRNAAHITMKLTTTLGV